MPLRWASFRTSRILTAARSRRPKVRCEAEKPVGTSGLEPFADTSVSAQHFSVIFLESTRGAHARTPQYLMRIVAEDYIPFPLAMSESNSPCKRVRRRRPFGFFVARYRPELDAFGTELVTVALF